MRQVSTHERSIPHASPHAVRQFWRTLHRLELLGFVLIAIGVFGITWISIASAGRGRGLTVAGPLYTTVSPAPPYRESIAHTAAANLRFFYQYSVIPGGVESGEELREAIADDPVVANHYSDFGLQHVSFVTLGRDQAFYVSYRLQSGVYWTSRPMLLHRGERLVTDGFNLARVRCGNRLSEVPLLPVSPTQPTPEEMNVAGVVRAPQGVLTSAQIFHRPVIPFIPIVPFFFLPGGGGGPVFFSLAPLPAPGYLTIVVICSLILLLRFALRRRFAADGAEKTKDNPRG